MNQYLRYTLMLCAILAFALSACDPEEDGSDNTPDGGNPDANTNSACDEDPCVNETACTDTDDGYECTCKEDGGGPNCEVDLTAPTTTCVLTFTLDEGNGADDDSHIGTNMRIRETLGALGDDTYGVGPGSLIIRLPSDGSQDIDPDGGLAEILYYELSVNFTTTTGGEIITTLTAASPEAGQNTGTVERATGTLNMTATPTITWDSCTYPPGYDADNESFTPDVEGTGDGCLSPYRSVGTVTCNAGEFVCGMGNLAVGPNDQNETWEQKVETFTFDAYLTNVSMPFMQVPNRSPSKTYMSWEGKRTSILCQ